MSIDYESLKFTNEEEVKLMNHKESIISWIMTNIIPCILPNDLITIDYGKDYRCPRSGELTTEYHLDICGGKSILSSHSGQHILIAHKFGNFTPLSEVNDCITIYSLIDNWSSIKNQLLASIKSKSEVFNKIDTFKV